jgi:hypothetical protein
VPQAAALKNANFRDEKQLKDEAPRMKSRISKILRFWVDAAEQKKGQGADKSKQALGAEVLHDFEQSGDERNYQMAKVAKTIELWVRLVLC